MANWQYKINLGKILDEADEETPEAVLECAKKIQAEIDTLPHSGRLFLNAPYKLVQQTKKAIDAGFDYDEVCDIFNGHLSMIYDLADENRVWVNG